jgi:hypothetical protein
MAAALFVFAGCGGGGAAGAEDANRHPQTTAPQETVQDCLIEVGVQFAVAPRDLAFFREARQAGDVVQIGSKRENGDDVVVRLLAARNGGAARWMLWYSQPPSSSKSPEEIINHPAGPEGGLYSPSHTYVAFKVKPKRSFRKEIRRCVAFPLAQSG